MNWNTCSIVELALFCFMALLIIVGCITLWVGYGSANSEGVVKSGQILLSLGLLLLGTWASYVYYWKYHIGCDQQYKELKGTG